MEPIPIPRKVSFFTTGYHPARFVSDVDEYFTCPVCAWVVRSPLACANCEALVCKSCHDRVASLREDICRGCKKPFAPAPVRRYPRDVYSRYVLNCSFTLTGCTFVGSVSDMSSHEETCGFRVVDCTNSRCCMQFRLMDRPFKDKLVCSQHCWDEDEFARIYENGPGSTQCLNFFVSCVSAHKEEFRRFLTAKYRDRLLTAEDELSRSKRELCYLEKKLSTLAKQHPLISPNAR